MPGEFERQEALLLAAGPLAQRCPKTFADIVAAVGEDIALLGTINSTDHKFEIRAALSSRGIPADRIRLVRARSSSRWMRDYGPIVVYSPTGQREVIDPIYIQPTGSSEDQFARAFASLLKLSPRSADVVLEGGNILSNGRGLCLTTSVTLLRNRKSSGCGHDYDKQQVSDLFKRHFGSTQTIFLEPLKGDRTGHADMFAVFTAPDTVVVGSYRPDVDPVNAAILNRNAARLADLQTPDGPLRVFRIPMPPNRDGVFRTYTNVLFANSTLLVPVYPGLAPEAEKEALAIYRKLLPKHKVAAIDATEVIARGGGLHCLATNIPIAKEGE